MICFKEPLTTGVPLTRIINFSQKSSSPPPGKLHFPTVPPGRNIRRTDHGEGLEALYDLLSKEKLSVSCFGLTKSSEEFSESFIKELVAGKTITMPARTTVIINNEKKA